LFNVWTLRIVFTLNFLANIRQLKGFSLSFMNISAAKISCGTGMTNSSNENAI